MLASPSSYFSSDHSYFSLVLAGYNRIGSHFHTFMHNHVKRVAEIATHNFATFIYSSIDTIWVDDSPHYLLSKYRLFFKHAFFFFLLVSTLIFFFA